LALQRRRGSSRQGSASLRRAPFSLGDTIRPQQPHARPRHRQRHTRARNDRDPKADDPADDQQNGGVPREAPRSQAGQPKQHPAQRKTPNDMVRPASSRPVRVDATSAGACSAAYGTTKASNHQS
jgi:hypothetical protein